MRKIESSFSPDAEKIGAEEEIEIEQEQGAEQLDDKEKTKVSGFFAHLDALSEKVFGPDAVKEVKEAWQENAAGLFRDLVKGVKENGLFIKWDKLDPVQKKKIIANGFYAAITLGGIISALAPEEAGAEEVTLGEPELTLEPDGQGRIDIFIEEEFVPEGLLSQNITEAREALEFAIKKESGLEGRDIALIQSYIDSHSNDRDWAIQKFGSRTMEDGTTITESLPKPEDALDENVEGANEDGNSPIEQKWMEISPDKVDLSHFENAEQAIEFFESPSQKFPQSNNPVTKLTFEKYQILNNFIDRADKEGRNDIVEALTQAYQDQYPIIEEQGPQPLTQETNPQDVGENQDEIKKANVKGADETAEKGTAAVAEIKYQGGTSVWKEAEKQLQARFAEKFSGSDLSDAERTYDIDKVKDLIEKHPDQYGLPKDINFNKMSTEQIASVDWGKAIEDSKITVETIDPNLSAEAEKSIAENNEKIAEWAKEHPGERLDAEIVDAILSGEEERVEKPVLQKEQEETRNPFKHRLEQNLRVDLKDFEPNYIDLDEPHNLLDKKEMSQQEEVVVAEAIKDYQGKVSEGENAKQAREQAVKTLLESAKGGDFEKLLEYGDYKETLKEATENALNDEISKGDGKLKFGSPSQEKILEFVHNLSRVYGLKEDESTIFESWLAGDDNKIDRDDLKERGLYDKRHFKEDLFGDKVKEFLDIAKSKGLPGKNWEPRTIHYIDDDGVKHAEIMNVRESDVTWYYEFDSDGDKHPNSDPRIENGSPGKRFPKDMAEAWLKEPAPTIETEPQKTTGIDREKPSTLPVKEPTEENIAIDAEQGKKIAENFLSNILKEKETKQIFGDLNLKDGINSDEEFRFLQSEYAGIFAQSTSGDEAAKTLRPHFESLIDDFIEQNKNFFAEKGVTSYKNLVPAEMLEAACEDATVKNK